MIIPATMFSSGSGLSPTTWNSADKSSNITLSGADLIATATSAYAGAVRSNTAKSGGKYGIEFTTNTNVDQAFGFMNLTTSPDSFQLKSSSIFGWYISGATSFYWTSAGIISGTSIDITAGAPSAVYVNLTTGLAWVTNDGISYNGGVGNPATGVGGYTLTSVPGPYYLVYGTAGSSPGFGSCTLDPTCSAYGLPSGFTAWGS